MSREPTDIELRCIHAATGPNDAHQGRATFRYDMTTRETFMVKLEGEINVSAMVRYAIRAMYEPTPEMIEAYMNSLENPAGGRKEPWHRAKMLKRWHAMIDAASPP